MMNVQNNFSSWLLRLVHIIQKERGIANSLFNLKLYIILNTLTIKYEVLSISVPFSSLPFSMSAESIFPWWQGTLIEIREEST